VRRGFRRDQGRQFVTIGQVAALAAVLASDGAASLSGAVLPIDGGWTAQ
jgi:3-hydroxybutyrate dehydrogenase